MATAEMSTEQLLEEMTKALQDALDTQTLCSETIDKLEKENQFLTDTILQKKLGKITEERRSLLEKMRKTKEKSERELKEAQEIRNEYDSKLEKVSKITKQALYEKESLDKCIEEKSEEKIKDIRDKNDENLKIEKKKLEKEYKKKEMALKKKEKIYWIIIGILGVLTIVGGCGIFVIIANLQ